MDTLSLRTGASVSYIPALYFQLSTECQSSSWFNWFSHTISHVLMERLHTLTVHVVRAPHLRIWKERLSPLCIRQPLVDIKQSAIVVTSTFITVVFTNYIYTFDKIIAKKS